MRTRSSVGRINTIVSTGEIEQVVPSFPDLRFSFINITLHQCTVVVVLQGFRPPTCAYVVVLVKLSLYCEEMTFYKRLDLYIKYYCIDLQEQKYQFFKPPTVAS